MPSTKSLEKSGGLPDMISHPCSLVSRMQNEDPVGSAAVHRRYLLLEVPLPWEYHVQDSRYFPKGLEAMLEECRANAAPFRFLGFDPGMFTSPEGCRRLMFFERPEVPTAFFRKQEYIVKENELYEVIEALLMQRELPSYLENIASITELDYAAAAEELSQRLPDPGYLLAYPGTRDLFVCSHGRHDLCCGKFGAPMYQEIFDRYVQPFAASEDSSSLPFRVWRTSHFGGHRHAPTILDLPEGRYWAQLKPEMLDTLLLRKGDFASIARHYRGWGGVPAFAQAVEREAFKREGWQWIHYDKQTAMLEEEETRAVVRIDYRSPDGTVSGRYEAEVRTGEPKEVGGCGNAPTLARQLKVVSIHKQPLIQS
ncbi:sucrase ferredoxin [Paenibacillus senegalensis]|uniref:sucrase ferredoxin n=1 Tax=Paenibacillus senegalensis TaxID=1465766 RepID=UPI000287A413|nr:sucrase ferredoxin [Paenibacillus senegalensis]